MTHSSKSISPLRQRMIDDMRLRKLKVSTQRHYVRSVIKLIEFLQHSPQTATAEELRSFQLHMVNQGVSSCTINATINRAIASGLLSCGFHVAISHCRYCLSE